MHITLLNNWLFLYLKIAHFYLSIMLKTYFNYFVLIFPLILYSNTITSPTWNFHTWKFLSNEIIFNFITQFPHCEKFILFFVFYTLENASYSLFQIIYNKVILWSLFLGFVHTGDIWQFSRQRSNPSVFFGLHHGLTHCTGLGIKPASATETMQDP